MPRYAFRISPQVIDMVAELTGSDETVFPDDTFIIFEIASPNQFLATIVDLDYVTELAKQDPTLQVV